MKVDYFVWTETDGDFHLETIRFDAMVWQELKNKIDISILIIFYKVLLVHRPQGHIHNKMSEQIYIYNIELYVKLE